MPPKFWSDTTCGGLTSPPLLSSSPRSPPWWQWRGLMALTVVSRGSPCFCYTMLRSEAVWFLLFIWICEIYERKRAVYDVFNTSQMLCSEVEWFPRFLQICNHHFRQWMGEEDMDYQAMKQILQCQCQGEVWSFLNAYNKMAFREWIQSQQELASQAVAREKRDR